MSAQSNHHLAYAALRQLIVALLLVALVVPLALVRTTSSTVAAPADVPLLAGPSAFPALAEGPWEIIPLTGLGGELIGNIAWDINDNGQAVGDARNGNDSAVVIWENGVPRNLEIPGATWGTTSINDLGQVAGALSKPRENRAYRWIDGTTTELPAYQVATAWDPLKQYDAEAFAINDSGQIVGVSDTSPEGGTTYSHAMLWDGNEMIDLDPTNQYQYDVAVDINDQGQITGEVWDGRGNIYAVIWDGATGGMTVLDEPSGWRFGRPRAMNNVGQVIGRAMNPDTNETHEFLWQNGSMTSLNTLTGIESFAMEVKDINDAGQIIGQQVVQIEGSSVRHAIIIDNGVITDLNDLLPANSGWELTDAIAINSGGQIVGAGTFNGQAGIGFLLSPATSCSLADTATMSTTTTRSLAAASRAQVSGRVVWGPNFAGKVGVGVEGAKVRIGCATATTDASGNYTLTAETGDQTIEVTRDIFSHSATGASATIVKTSPVTISSGTTTLPTLDGFGGKVELTALKQTNEFSNVQFSTTGFTVSGTFNVPIEGDPIPVTLTATYTQSTDAFTLKATSGNLSWNGQQATITDFSYASPANTLTFAGKVALKLGGLALDADLTGTWDGTDLKLTGKGKTVVNGVTIDLDEISADTAAKTYYVKGRLKLPNQPAAQPDSTFEASLVQDTVNLDVALNNFTFDGNPAQVRLVYTSGPPKLLKVVGTAQTKVAGLTMAIAIDTLIDISNTKVDAKVELEFKNAQQQVVGKAEAMLRYDPPAGTMTGTAQLRWTLTPCPGATPGDPVLTKLFDVAVTIKRDSLDFDGSASIALPCAIGGGTATVGAKKVGQDLSLDATVPFTVNDVAGQFTFGIKNGTDNLSITAGVQIRFGPGGGAQQQIQQSQGMPDDAAFMRSTSTTVDTAATQVRVLIVDPYGNRTGYDSSTGTILTEIPGSTYNGMVNNVDSISVPAILGGYRAEITSATGQTVILEAVNESNNQGATIVVSTSSAAPHFVSFGTSPGPNGTLLIGATDGTGSSDGTPPVITVPSDIVVKARTSRGSFVRYTVEASDAVDGTVNPTCSPASGSSFPVGTTVVTCTAIDAAGNEGTASFTVSVTADASVQSVELSNDVSRCRVWRMGKCVTATAALDREMKGVTIIVIVTRPDGSKRLHRGVTNSQGVARFDVQLKGSGIYTARVIGASKRRSVIGVGDITVSRHIAY